jgi:hypothetical protein
MRKIEKNRGDDQKTGISIKETEKRMQRSLDLPTLKYSGHSLEEVQKMKQSENGK